MIAKSTGEQEEEDMEPQDAALFRYLKTGKKISKEEANYREQRQDVTTNNDGQACMKCKFNLTDEKMCHIVEGTINNEQAYQSIFLLRVKVCCLEMLYGNLSRRQEKN